MEEAKIKVMGVMVIITLFGCQYLIKGVKGSVAAVEEEFCLGNCIKGCKTNGISALRCFRYCANHCGAPAVASSAQKSPTLQYCKLGCMLDRCAIFSDDEGKQKSCVANCQKNVCLVG